VRPLPSIVPASAALVVGGGVPVSKLVEQAVINAVGVKPGPHGSPAM
jgi:hypothetical protein